MTNKARKQQQHNLKRSMPKAVQAIVGAYVRVGKHAQLVQLAESLSTSPYVRLLSDGDCTFSGPAFLSSLKVPCPPDPPE